MNRYLDDLNGAIREVKFEGKGSFYWFGERSRPPGRLEQRFGAREAKDELRLRLQRRLYWNFYTCGKATPLFEDDGAEPGDEAAFVEELSSANCSRGVLEHGWRIIATDRARLTIERNGLRLRVQPKHVVGSRSSPITIRGPKELCGVSPGFYTALGEIELRPRTPLTRVYWNVRASGAAPLIHAITRTMNRASVAFRVKVSSHPVAFDRRDSAVLYVQRNTWKGVRSYLRAIERSLRQELNEGVPALTKAIAAGVGVADDPIDDASFGGHRCLLIASALVDAHNQRETRDERRFDYVIRAFRQNGVRPERPYLNAASRDIYAEL